MSSEEVGAAAYQPLLQKLYAAFNARDIDAVLPALHPDVDWPNGWEVGASVAVMRFAPIGRVNGPFWIPVSPRWRSPQT